MMYLRSKVQKILSVFRRNDKFIVVLGEGYITHICSKTLKECIDQAIKELDLELELEQSD